MLKVHLLGKSSFQISQKDRPVFRKSLRLRILGFLIRVGEPVSRKRLSRIFWPHLSDQDARTYLRNVLARLKDDFAPWLEITRDTICFKIDSDSWVDLYELEKILAQYKDANLDELEYAEVSEYKHGLGLYKGEYMADLTRSISPWFDEWLESERSFLRSQVSEAYKKLVDYRVKKRDWQNGIEEARQIIHIDQKDETGWLLLMKCLANSGDLRRAQEAYERYNRFNMSAPDQSSTAKHMDLLYRRIGQRISGTSLILDDLDLDTGADSDPEIRAD